MTNAARKELEARDGPDTDESPALPVMVAARALLLEGASVRIRVGTVEATATLDPSVHPSVVATAVARGERVVVEREAGAWVVLGVLRTAPTPGIEEADEYVIRAARVRVRAKDEFTVASGAASFAVRAYGTIETLAEQITSRASAVHKIVGRMLHLN
ncbi:MAG: hypothetical protein KF764_21180 [Labilithrix sp.]|nr:hypothetical protein [Labilithrix sp.]MBX3222293.1 hypothetical protein [Labilithrix sp.]